MVVVRGAWSILAIGALYFAVAGGTVSDISLSCSKTGTYDDRQSGVQCGDPIYAATGALPLITLGLLLVLPPVLAALAMRPWVSWTAVATFALLSLWGVAQWSGFWGQLLIAVPMLFVALVISFVQQAMAGVEDD